MPSGHVQTLPTQFPPTQSRAVAPPPSSPPLPPLPDELELELEDELPSAPGGGMKCVSELLHATPRSTASPTSNSAQRREALREVMRAVSPLARRAVNLRPPAREV